MKIVHLRPEGRILKLLWNIVCGSTILFLAFVPLLVLNLAQFPSLILLPFWPKGFRAYNRFMAFCVWGYWAWGMKHIVGMELVMSGDEVPRSEDAIVFANHQSMSDILVLICLALEKGRVGDLKWMVKDIIKYVPGIGWGMIFLDCLFLKRNWSDDEANIRAAFARFIKARIPLWMVSFPEGTRLTPSKLEASQAYAEHSALPLTEHVLLPRPRGFVATVHGLRDLVQAVYSVTIRYEGKAPKLTHMIRGDVNRVFVDLKRVPITAMPNNDKQLGAWLLSDFYRKDHLMAASSSPQVLA